MSQLCDLGLYKIGTGNNLTTPGQVYQHVDKPLKRPQSPSLAIIDQHLFLRSGSMDDDVIALVLSSERLVTVGTVKVGYSILTCVGGCTDDSSCGVSFPVRLLATVTLRPLTTLRSSRVASFESVGLGLIHQHRHQRRHRHRHRHRHRQHRTSPRPCLHCLGVVVPFSILSLRSTRGMLFPSWMSPALPARPLHPPRR